MPRIFLIEVVVVNSSDPKATSESFKTVISSDKSRLWSLGCFEEVPTINFHKNANVISSIFLLHLKKVGTAAEKHNARLVA